MDLFVLIQNPIGYRWLPQHIPAVLMTHRVLGSILAHIHQAVNMSGGSELDETLIFEETMIHGVHLTCTPNVYGFSLVLPLCLLLLDGAMRLRRHVFFPRVDACKVIR